MSEVSFTQLNDEYAVTPQLRLEDVQAVSQAGFRTLLINRPDGEGGPQQPTSAEMIAAAESLGIKAVYLPLLVVDRLRLRLRSSQSSLKSCLNLS